MSEWKETNLGKVSSNFIEYKVEDIAIKMADAPFGSSIKNDDYETEGVVVVQGNNINGRKCNWDNLRFVNREKYLSLPRSHCFIGDLVFPKVGTIGKVGILTEYNSANEYLLSTNTMMLRVNPEKANQNFVYYFFSSERVKDFIELINPNSVQPVFNFTSLKRFSIYLPPLPEQTAIAEVLSSLDDKIDLLHRQNKTLEQLAETLFRQWFVEEAEESWEEKELWEFGSIVCGKTPSKKVHSFFGGNIPFIKIPDMHGRVFLFDTEDSLTEEGANSQKNKFLPSKSICVSCIATVGLVSMNVVPSQTNQQINSIIPSKDIYRYFLYLKMKSMKDELLAMASGGTATDNLNTGNFSKIKLLAPGDERLKEFHLEVEPLFDKVFSNTNQIKTLTQLRDILLPKLMSGEVRVKIN